MKEYFYKNTFAKKFTVLALAGVLGFALSACDNSSSASNNELPAEVYDLAELDTYECNDEITGKKIYVSEQALNYECDGKAWQKTNDKTKPSSSSNKTSSSSSKKNTSDINPENLKTADFLNPEISYGEIKDSRDGEVYKTVKIGDQTWIAENLRYRYKGKTASLDSSSFCFEDNPENCKKFGRMYLWSAVMDSAGILNDDGKGCGNGVKCRPSYPVQGICPEGFHVPNGIEYQKLLYYAGAHYQRINTGYYLHDANAFYSEIGSNGKKTTGTDDYGFSAVMSTHSEYYKTIFSVFWTSVQRSSEYSKIFYLSPQYAAIYDNGSLESSHKNYLRCIKTEEDSTYAISTDIQHDLNRAVACKTDEVDTCKYGTLVDSRDGQKYKTVQVGYMIWMAENLNYRYLQPSATEDSTSSCYENDPENCKKDGRLYSYSAAVDSAGIFSDNGKGCGYGIKYCPYPDTGFIRGVCPEGWHLPSGAEVLDLRYMAYKNKDIESKTEFSAGGAFSLGLNIRPVGIKRGHWYEGYGALMWTSSSVEEKYATYIQVHSYLFDHDWEYQEKNNHMSVRCVRHFDSYEPTEPDTKISFPTFDETIPVVDPCRGTGCSDSIVDERDGKVYRTVKIGDQWWMQDNLRLQDTTDTLYNKYDKEYPWSVAMDSAGIYSTDGKGCGNGKFCSTSGKVRGICPKGWHLPTTKDFWTLMAHASDKPLKWKDDINNLYFRHTATQYTTQYYGSKALTSCYWASTEKTEETASQMCVSADDGSLFANFVSTSGGIKKNKDKHTVRCIKD